jgi:signal peptidase II
LRSGRFRDLVVFGVALVLLIADQISKHWARTSLVLGVPYDPIPWLRPIFSFTLVTNEGAAFGLFPQLKPIYPWIYVMVIAFILFTYRRLAADNRLIQISLGMQLGGAAGNLADRLLRGGEVSDFIDLNFWPLHDWPVFNIADSSLVVGVCILAFFLLTTPDAALPERGEDA